MHRLLIAALVVFFALPFALANPVAPTCVLEDGCFPYPQGVCTSSDGYIAWYPIGADPDVTYGEQCEQIDCDTGGVCERMQRVACQSAGGVENGTACGGSGPGLCQNGQTDCVCAGQIISDGQWCCQGAVQDTPECAGTDPTDPPDTLCGNGLRDPGEECDGDDLGTCQSASGVSQACTQNCRCAYDDDYYDPGDDWCSPGEEGADCGSAECRDETAEPSVAEVSAVIGDLSADVSWSANVLQICETQIQEFIVRFTDQDAGGGGAQSTPSDTRQYRYTALEPETVYDVQVGAVYPGGTIWSSPVTFTTGHPDCYGTDKRSWCKPLEDGESFSKTRYLCDSENMRSSETCDGKCYPTTEDDGTPSAACQDAVDCDLCDGAYDSFGEVLSGVTQEVQFGDTQINLECDELAGWNTAQGEVTFCYLDHSYSALKEYRDCSSTTYCNDYGTADGCADDPCLVRGTCEWVSPGLCTAQEPDYQRCDSQSQERCEAEGDACFWQGGECVGADEAICEFFEDQDSCSGGSDFTIDPSTNEPTDTSSNQFGLPKCDWLESRDRCVKDADDDDSQDPIEYAEDFTNPVTSLLVPPASTEWGPDPVIPYAVSEPVLATYAQVTPGACGTPSRPDSTAAVDPEAGMISFTGLSTGVHCLQYYSKDLGHNLEVVKQEELNVNAEQLVITSIDFVLEPWEQRGTWDVTAEVTTSRSAWCTITFSATQGDTIAWGPVWSDAFRRRYVDQVDGQYRLDVSCELDSGASAMDNRTLLLDLDARITQPIPAVGTYRSDQLAFIGVHTRDPDATCAYVDGSTRTPLSRQRSVTIDGAAFTLHFTDAPAGQTGLQVYPVVCTFPGGLEIFGSEADTIIYAIDDTPPETIIMFNDQGTPAVAGSVVPVGSGQATINVTCQDASIPGRDQQWEAGCEQTLVDMGNGFEPLGGLSINVQDGDTLRFKSIDALGNEESARTIQIVSDDISGPERPAFVVEGSGQSEQDTQTGSDPTAPPPPSGGAP